MILYGRDDTRREIMDYLSNIRRSTNLTIQLLARMFGLSRKDVYDLLAGEHIVFYSSETTMRRIKSLSRIADAFQEARVPRTSVYALLTMNAFVENSMSLLDMVWENYRITSEHIQFLIDEWHAQNAAYHRSGLAASTAPATDDWWAELSP